MQGACLTLAIAAITVQVGRAAPATTATVKYGIVFDAGSSGSRIHVYSWKVGGGGPKDAFDLIKDDLLKVKPGLSAYRERPAEAGSSLRELLNHARAAIPKALHAETPIFLMATAGLRMVGEQAKDAILASVCSELSSSGFLFRCEWATLLSGTDEGVYGWVTVNYLLDALYPPAAGTATVPPVGIIDLGGGSVQVVFASGSGAGLTHMDFGGRAHDTYIKSHLGYGLDEARRRTLEYVVSKSNRAEKPARHPCLPKGATATGGGVSVAGEGDWARCLKLTSKLFSEEAWSIADMPPLPASVYGFSYMYDRTAAIGLLDSQPKQFGSVPMTIEAIAEAGKAVCGLDSAANMARFAGTQDAAKSQNYCGDAAYVAALLGALGFKEHTPLTMTNKIRDVELVWTLGAMLAKSAELAAGGGLLGSSSLLSRALQIGVAGLAVYLLCRCCKAPGSALRERRLS